MPIPISTLPLPELVQMYRNAINVQRVLKVRQVFGWTLTDIEEDMQMLYAAMVTKIPDSHLAEINNILSKRK